MITPDVRSTVEPVGVVGPSDGRVEAWFRWADGLW